MFQNFFRAVQNLFVDQPGTIYGTGINGERLPADESITLSLSPLIPMDTSGIKFGMAPIYNSALEGYRFSGVEKGEKLSGYLSPDAYEAVVADMKAQIEMFGRVIELPAQLGGSGLPFPDLNTLPDADRS